MWCGNNIPTFVSNDHWIYWLSSWPVSKEKIQRMYAIIASSLWWLWRYRNSVTFNSLSKRKCDIFDNIRLYFFLGLSLEAICLVVGLIG